MREDLIVDAVNQFYAQRVFGPSRRELFLAELNQVDDSERQALGEQRQRLQRQLADIARKQDNVMRQAEDADPRDPFTQGLRARYNDLDTERQSISRPLPTSISKKIRNQIGPASNRLTCSTRCRIWRSICIEHPRNYLPGCST